MKTALEQKKHPSIDTIPAQDLNLSHGLQSHAPPSRATVYHHMHYHLHAYSLACVTLYGSPTHSRLAAQLKVTTVVDLCQ